MMNQEQAQDMVSSLLWAGIVEELDRKIFYELSKLKTCTPEELPTIQLKIQCWEQLKNLPQDILDRESQ